MHNKLYNDLTILSKFFVTILLVIIFNITNSIYLLWFVPILIIYLLLLNNHNINKYLQLLRNYFFLLLVIFLIIILFKGFNWYLLYKYVISILLINTFIVDLNFDTTNTLFYRLLLSKYASYKLTLFAYSLNIFFASKSEIRKFQNERGIKKYGFRYGLLSRIEYSKYMKDKLDNNNKTSFYEIKSEKSNLLSFFMTLLFIIILIIVIVRK